MREDSAYLITGVPCRRTAIPSPFALLRKSQLSWKRLDYRAAPSESRRRNRSTSAAFPGGVESAPQRRTFISKVSPDGHQVMQFVRSDYQQPCRDATAQVLEVIFLPLFPLPLGTFLERIRATAYYCLDLLPKLVPDFRQHWLSAAVFHNIMQQGGDCLYLCSAIFENESGHSKDVGQVRNLSALPSLFAVEMRSLEQGFIEFARQRLIQRVRLYLLLHPTRGLSTARIHD